MFPSQPLGCRFFLAAVLVRGCSSRRQKTTATVAAARATAGPTAGPTAGTVGVGPGRGRGQLLGNATRRVVVVAAIPAAIPAGRRKGCLDPSLHVDGKRTFSVTATGTGRPVARVVQLQGGEFLSKIGWVVNVVPWGPVCSALCHEIFGGRRLTWFGGGMVMRGGLCFGKIAFAFVGITVKRFHGETLDIPGKELYQEEIYQGNSGKTDSANRAKGELKCWIVVGWSNEKGFGPGANDFQHAKLCCRRVVRATRDTKRAC